MAVARPPKAFDVWFVTANTVYKQVPYGVVADWTQEGRLGTADMVKAAGSADGWTAVGKWPLFADYLPRPAQAVRVATTAGAADAAPVEPPEPADDHAAFRSKLGEDDDEIDMIPLIDISMVLLVFFIIVSATGALSPVDVPDMRYAGELSSVADAVTITIEKAGADDIFYSVREGPNAAKPDYARLPNSDEAVKALDSILADRTRPPEVRVSCDKTLPSDRVIELTRELSKRREQNKINSFVATVNEAPNADK